jgi:hypothetical protein
MWITSPSSRGSGNCGNDIWIVPHHPRSRMTISRQMDGLKRAPREIRQLASIGELAQHRVAPHGTTQGIAGATRLPRDQDGQGARVQQPVHSVCWSHRRDYALGVQFLNADCDRDAVVSAAVASVLDRGRAGQLPCLHCRAFERRRCRSRIWRPAKVTLATGRVRQVRRGQGDLYTPARLRAS